MIIIAAAKTMNNNNKLEFECSKDTKKLVNKIQEINKVQLCDIFKIKNKICEQTSNYYANFLNNKGNYAIIKYNGLVYKQIESESLKNEKFLKNNVYIISALYGCINSMDIINNYRLDFSAASNKIAGENLYNFWIKKNEKYLAINSKNKTILNLSSKEYLKALGNLENYIVYNIESINKIPNTYLKKVRGKILNYVIKSKIENYELLINYKDEEIEIKEIKNNIIYYEYKINI